LRSGAVELRAIDDVDGHIADTFACLRRYINAKKSMKVKLKYEKGELSEYILAMYTNSSSSRQCITRLIYRHQ
jgi:hypothetical protein